MWIGVLPISGTSWVHMYIYLFLIFNERFILCATNRTTTTKTAKPSSFSLFFFGCLFFFFFKSSLSDSYPGLSQFVHVSRILFNFQFSPNSFFFSCYSFPSSCFHIASLFCSISSYFSTSLWRNITFFALLSQNFHEALCQISLNYVGQIALV